MGERRHDTAFRRLVERVRDEYLEMPGLSLTLPQGCRLWVLDEERCRAVFRILSERGFLTRTVDGQFLRVPSATYAHMPRAATRHRPRAPKSF